MKIHVLQHVAFEDIGAIADWAKKQAAEFSYSRFFAPDFLQPVSFPALGNFDFLIVLGGPMSINDEAEYPWLVQEKAFIRQAIDAGKPVLGICLGAQLIASVLGATVYPSQQKEIGWFPVEGIVTTTTAFDFPASVEVFHWHGETFDLPAGSVHLAQSAGCQHQAFQYQQNVIGLQFHLETTLDTARQIIAYCENELVEGQPYIQSAAQMLALTPQKTQAVNMLLHHILDYLVKPV